MARLETNPLCGLFFSFIQAASALPSPITPSVTLFSEKQVMSPAGDAGIHSGFMKSVSLYPAFFFLIPSLATVAALLFRECECYPLSGGSGRFAWAYDLITSRWVHGSPL